MDTKKPEPAWGHVEGFLDLQVAQGAAESKLDALDRTLIIDTLHRYGWAYDERRLDVMRSCFTEDLEFRGSVGGAVQVGPFRGWSLFEEFLEGHMHVQIGQRRHMVLTDVVERLGSDSASTLSYLFLTSVEAGVMRVITSGFYQCELVKDGEVWRIRSMFAGFDSPF